MRILATAAALALLLGIVLARAEYRPAVLVLPLQAGAGLTPSEAAIGVGIQVVLENMLAAQGSLEETWAEDAYSRLFRSAGDFRQWLRNAQPTMPSLARVPARYIARGMVGRQANQLFVTLVVQDRQTGREARNRIQPDFPELKSLRQTLIGLLGSLGIPSLVRDASVLWDENLSGECLNLLGAGVAIADAQFWPGAGDISVPQPLIAAAASCPKSYVAQATLAWQQTQADAEGNGADAGSAAMELNGRGVRAREWLLEAAFGVLKPDLAKKGADAIMAIRGHSAFDDGRFEYWMGRIAFIQSDFDEAERRLRESIRY